MCQLEASVELVANSVISILETTAADDKQYKTLRALHKAYEAISTVLNGLQSGITWDYVAMNNRHAFPCWDYRRDTYD